MNEMVKLYYIGGVLDGFIQFYDVEKLNNGAVIKAVNPVRVELKSNDCLGLATHKIEQDEYVVRIHVNKIGTKTYVAFYDE